MIRCNRCKNSFDVVSPVIRKQPGNKYVVNAICMSCNKPITRKLSKTQIQRLPKSILDANDYSTFTDYKDEKTGGILPLIPLLAAIFGGLTAAGSTAGVVANSVLQAKKNEEEQRHNLEVEKAIRGQGISEHEGGFLPIIPLIGAIVAASKAFENTKSGNGLHEHQGGFLPIIPLIGAIVAAAKAIENTKSGSGLQEHQGGFIPIPALLGLIFSGLTAAGSTAGAVANSVLQAKKNDEEQRHHLEMEKAARGQGINQSSRTLDEIVNSIDNVSDDEKRKLLSVYQGLGFDFI
jgi:hypothetical protein